MQVVRYIVVLGVLLMLNQIAAASTAVFAKASETRYAQQMKPPRGKALVYIYEREQGSATSPRIWLNNYEIGRLVPGSFTVWQLAPGRLELRVGGSNPTTLSLQTQAGKVYSFRLDVIGDSAKIDGMPLSFRSELASLQLIKNPRQVVATAKPSPTVKAAPPPKQTVASAPAKPRPRHNISTQEALRPGGMILYLKTGSFSLSKDHQTIIGVNTTFEKSASSVYDVELDLQSSNGVSYGGELLSYKSSYVGAGLTPNTGDVTFTAIMANTKMYFRNRSHLQPYFGVGFGLAVAKATGALTGDSAGFAYQLLAGLEYRTPAFGIFAEAKYLGADTKDSGGNKLDGSGSGVLAGIALHF